MKHFSILKNTLKLDLYKRAWTIVGGLYILFLIFSFTNDMDFFDFTYYGRTSYFSASGNPNAVLFYIILKIIFISLSLGFFLLIAVCLIKIINGDEAIKQRVELCCIIIAIHTIILLHVYPGIWWCSGADEFQLLSFAKHLQIQYHQGTLASVIYILGLMCYPKPAMVVLFQIIVGGGILGNIAYDLYKENKRNIISVLMLFFSPCVVYFALYPMRAYLFGVFFLAFTHYYIKYQDSNDVRQAKWYLLTFLACLIINLRTESKFLLFIYPLLLFLKKCKLKVILRLEIMILCSIIFVSGLNSLGYQACNKAHKYIMFSGPLSLFLTDNKIDKTDWEQDIQNIDKILNVAELEKNGIFSPSGGERSDSTYTDEDVQAFIKSSIRIMLRYPLIYITAKLKCMKVSLGFRQGYIKNYTFPDKIQPSELTDYFKDVDKNTHDIFAAIITGQYKLANVTMFFLFYAFWIPCCCLIIIFFIALRKNKFLVIADMVLIIHFGLTVLTSPGYHMMYYFPEYLVGWYLMIYSLRYFHLIK